MEEDWVERRAVGKRSGTVKDLRMKEKERARLSGERERP